MFVASISFFFFFFFFKQKTAYEMRISDWSSDVCSSDLDAAPPMTANNAIFIDPRDSVATALRDLDAGERLDVAEGITLTEPVARGHKIAVVDIAAGAPVITFGFPIGTAKAAIARGAHVPRPKMATALTADSAQPYTPAHTP